MRKMPVIFCVVFCFQSFLVRVYVFFWTRKKHWKRVRPSEKDELESVCFLWKCVWMSWEQIHLFAVWDKRFIVIVTQKSTQRGSEYEEDMWDLWLFQGNLGLWFMLLHLPTLTVPLVFIVFPCFSYNWTCNTLQGTNISRLGKRKTIFKNALVGDMLVPRRLLYTSFKKLWRSYHGCQPSHQAVLHLNRHDCSFVPQQTCWPKFNHRSCTL